ncbi:MAG: CCA tRNA nucleotidyltransferase [Victivallales bacterium]|nr:CCA tRNA nucleotidyltransferase [Victivallales bacterium]
MRIPFENSLFKDALQVTGALNKAGHSAYMVGGCVRDMLMGLQPHDFDIATSALPEDVLSIFPHCHRIGAAFGIIDVVLGEHSFEVSTFREERSYSDGRHPEDIKYTRSPELDARRRDFTINAMFYDPTEGVLLDFVGGQRDVRYKLLRTVGDPMERFAEDYLRLLRAVRFTVRFGLKTSPDLLDAIKANTGGLAQLSAERIRDELNKMLTGPSPDVALEMLSETGILSRILPEIEALRGVRQPPRFHPEGDVFIHTKLMLRHMTFPNVLRAWAILLHDVGKPCTFSVGADGVEHFYSHEEKGAKIAEEVLSRMKFSRRVVSDIVEAVAKHMRFAHISKMRKAKLQRLLAQDNFPLHLELHRTDCMSSHAKMDQYVFALDKLNENAGQPPLPDPLVNGRDLISIGIPQSPKLGKILAAISDMQIEGALKSRDEALEKAAKMYRENGGLAK